MHRPPARPFFTSRPYRRFSVQCVVPYNAGPFLALPLVSCFGLGQCMISLFSLRHALLSRALRSGNIVEFPMLTLDCLTPIFSAPTVTVSGVKAGGPPYLLRFLTLPSVTDSSVFAGSTPGVPAPPVC
jgi:hypothetical protein